MEAGDLFDTWEESVEGEMKSEREVTPEERARKLIDHILGRPRYPAEAERFVKCQTAASDEIRAAVAAERSRLYGEIVRAGDIVWDEYSSDSQWGAAQQAAVTTLMDDISQIFRAEPEGEKDD